MSKLQLIYFNLRALCEAPRMMLHTAGIEYSYEMAWDYFKKPWGDVKKEVIFHKLPLLVIDEKIEIWQSNTISRYIAKLTNNIPNNEEMVAYADSIFESAHDLFFPLNPTINVWVGEMHLKNKKNLLNKILPKALGKILFKRFFLFFKCISPTQTFIVGFKGKNKSCADSNIESAYATISSLLGILFVSLAIYLEMVLLCHISIFSSITSKGNL